MITTQELIEFKERNNIVLGCVSYSHGDVWGVVSGSWNFACPFECMAIQQLLWDANGVGE